jgi:hypothetical protein
MQTSYIHSTTLPPIHKGIWVSLVHKQPESEAEHKFPSNVKAKTVWSHTSITLYAFNADMKKSIFMTYEK